MNPQQHTAPYCFVSETIRRCPYCRGFNSIQPAVDYAPIYEYCAACGRRFIVERIRHGISMMRLEDAPCASDPECRIIEMGQGDEE